jgi:hypothetical protein
MSHVDDGTLHAYLDGELAPSEAQGVETHLAQCAGCRMRLEEERALITRAAELLGRAAPPDRELPPLRPGDVRPPVRLWWQVRLPVAWAATVALALGIGMYLGPTVGRGPEPAARADSDHAMRLQPQVVPVTGELAERAPHTTRRGTARTPPAKPPAVPAPAVEADQLERLQAEAQPPAAPAYVRNEAAAAAESQGVTANAAPRRDAVRGSPIDADSAHLVLGAAPLAVPDLPVRGMYRARLIGYSAVVIVEQSLDSSLIIEVINARPAPATRKTAAAPSAALRAADQSVPGLWLEVRGPLSADSLAALRRRLRPLRP